MSRPRSGLGAAVALVAIALAVGCGSGSSGPASSSDRVCAYGGSGGTVRMQSGSSHAHIWRDLTVDLASGQLTGRVSSSVQGQPHVVEVDETVDDAPFQALRSRLAETCGALSSADAPPDDVAGGSTTLTVESASHGRFVVVGAGLTSTVAAETRVLRVSRDDYLAVVDAFPEPSSASPP